MTEEALRPSGTPPYWAPGSEILWRYQRIVPGYTGPESAVPVRVVRDDADGLVAWLAPGTWRLRGVLPDGGELRSIPAVDAFRAGRAVRRDQWQGPGILKVAPTGMPWSVWCFRNDDWSFRGWYVNLEDVHVRDQVSIATQDHVLDVWVETDRSVRWKDEDELEAAVIAGRFSAADAERFRADARDVEALVRAWQSPFNDGWETWRPESAWPVPQLPAGIRWDYPEPG